MTGFERYDEGLADFWDACGPDKLGAALFVLRNPVRAARAVGEIARLPVLRLRLGDLPADEAFRRAVRHRGITRHDFALFGAAVLEVPEDPAEFLKGRRQQTTRRMVRKAHSQGLRCRAVQPHERAALLELANRMEREHPDETYRVAAPQNEDLLDHPLWRVCELDGRPLLLAVLPVSDDWALLRYFRTPGHSDTHTLARWAALDDAVEALSAGGVRALLDTVLPATQTPGLRHFQRMAGFRYVRLLTRDVGVGKADPLMLLSAFALGGVAATAVARQRA